MMTMEVNRPERTTTQGRWYLERSGLDALISALHADGRTVIGPTVADGAVVYDEIRSSADMPHSVGDVQGPGRYRLTKREDARVFGYVVGPTSWKKWVFPPFVELNTGKRAGHRVEFTPTRPEAERLAFIGARACELAAFGIRDRVLDAGPFRDSDYASRRSSALIIAVQCTTAEPTCFCTSMGTAKMGPPDGRAQPSDRTASGPVACVPAGTPGVSAAKPPRAVGTGRRGPAGRSLEARLPPGQLARPSAFRSPACAPVEESGPGPSRVRVLRREPQNGVELLQRRIGVAAVGEEPAGVVVRGDVAGIEGDGPREGVERAIGVPEHPERRPQADEAGHAVRLGGDGGAELVGGLAPAAVHEREPAADEVGALALAPGGHAVQQRISHPHADGARGRELARRLRAVPESPLRHRHLVVKPCRVRGKPQGRCERVARRREIPAHERDAREPGESRRRLRREAKGRPERTLGLVETIEEEASFTEADERRNVAGAQGQRPFVEASRERHVAAAGLDVGTQVNPAVVAGRERFGVAIGRRGGIPELVGVKELADLAERFGQVRGARPGRRHEPGEVRFDSAQLGGDGGLERGSRWKRDGLEGGRPRGVRHAREQAHRTQERRAAGPPVVRHSNRGDRPWRRVA